nr:acylphosphatase [Metabacillus arenae]
MKHYHLIVSGKVQGVGFRFFSQTLAAEHHVYGWAKNLEDGSVEIKAEGDETNLDEFVAALRKGNRFAKVAHIELSAKDEIEGFTSFKTY